MIFAIVVVPRNVLKIVCIVEKVAALVYGDNVCKV